MASGSGSTVTVEFFGPFREFGKVREVRLSGSVGYGELVGILAGELGEEFSRRAARKNTTVIVNNRIADRKRLDSVEIKPGDRVAFALLMGGG
jgi:molybdopterin converting factor small subunit